MTFRALLCLLVLAISITGNAQPREPTTIEELFKDGRTSRPVESKCGDIACDYYLDGAITGSSLTKLRAFLAAKPAGRSLTVHFDSPGGDVREAIAIGRMLRANAPTIGVVFPGTCSSACVLSLVGTTTRILRGAKIGVHRPYTIGTSDISAENHAKAFRALEDSVRQYLAEMNIPTVLLDEMLRYDAEKIHFMSPDELARYRLNGTDHVWQDRADSVAARRYGLDKTTYLQRKAKAERECTLASGRADGKLPDAYEWQQFLECQQAIFAGKR